MNKSYPAKLLLFGEYTIIKGSLALAVPHTIYSGTWQKVLITDRSKEVEASQISLYKISTYLEDLQKKTQLKSFLDLKKFQFELENGLWFDSSIPTGYGLGSSGAVCAGIYSRFNSLPTADLSILRDELSQIEGFFHGESSGIDPLVSYLQQAVLIKNKNSIEILPEFRPQLNNGPGAIFLIDTQISRETTPLVNYYLERSKGKSFQKNYINPLSEIVESSIRHLLKQEYSNLLSSVFRISALQNEYMTHFIPLPFQKVWEFGLKTEKYALKLCGAGGGGVILGFTKNWQETEAELSNYSISKLYSLD